MRNPFPDARWPTWKEALGFSLAIVGWCLLSLWMMSR